MCALHISFGGQANAYGRAGEHTIATGEDPPGHHDVNYTEHRTVERRLSLSWEIYGIALPAVE